jgi:hypothetical protein
MASYARQEAARRPVAMTEIPKDRWPAYFRTDPQAPRAAYESREFLAQLYDVGEREGRATLRLSIYRVTLKDDGQCGFAGWYAVEVYPPDWDIVNVANMRHLWLLSTPLTIGWFNENTQQHCEGQPK